METLIPRFFNKDSDPGPGGTLYEIETIPPEFYFPIPDEYSHNVIEERILLPQERIEQIAGGIDTTTSANRERFHDLLRVLRRNTGTL